MTTQVILVIIIAAFAVFFIGVRFYKMFSGKHSGGDCPNCGLDAGKTVKKEKVV